MQTTQIMDKPSKARENTHSRDGEKIQALVVSIGGVRAGVDMDQIAELRDAEQIDPSAIEIVKPAERLAFRDVVATATENPKILMLKDENRKGILIDDPKDIITIPIHSIKLLPRMVNANPKAFPFWGAAMVNDEVLLLLDGYRLLAYRPATETLSG